MPRKKSERIFQPERTLLRVEELEERIAPVIVTADPTTWIRGSEFSNYNFWGLDGTDSDWYFIWYIGPGQADIRNTGGGGDLTWSHIGDITITGSDITSGLFIMQAPLSDEPAQNAEDMPWVIEAGTLLVEGDITVFGDIGCIEIDGVWGTTLPVPQMFVDGTLGKFDVGQLIGDIHAEEDIWEIHVDTSFGVQYDEGNNVAIWIPYGDITVEANGNIGSIIVGGGLNDTGEDTEATSIFGGQIDDLVTIRANADDYGDPGIIDLIRVYRGSGVWDGTGGGTLGYFPGSHLPIISAGPGGNVRFIHIDGFAYYQAASGIAQPLDTIAVGIDSPLTERTIVDDSGGVMVLNPQAISFGPDNLTVDDFWDFYDQQDDPDTPYEITWQQVGPKIIPMTASDGESITYFGAVEYLLIPVGDDGTEMTVARMVAHGSNDFNISGNVEIGDFAIGINTEYPEGIAEDFTGRVDDEGNPVPDINALPIITPSDLLDLTGYAHSTFKGPGECDIYFVDASNNFRVMTFAGAPSPSIPIINNTTRDGDIVSAAADENIIFIGASNRGGDIGATESITPYLIRTNNVALDGDAVWVHDDAEAPFYSPHGLEGNITRYNCFYGVFAETGNIYGIKAGGAVGDVRAPGGNIHFVRADSNNMRDPGSPFVASDIRFVDDLMGYGHTYGNISFFGRISNHVGDGVFGKIWAGSGVEARDSLIDGLSGNNNILLVHLGQGLTSTEIDIDLFTYITNDGNDPVPNPILPGMYSSSGIYASGYIDRVRVTGTGHGIFGDIAAQGIDLDTFDGINNISATNGAVIDGTGSWAGLSFISGSSTDIHFDGFARMTTIGTVSVSGAGSRIENTFFLGMGVGTITARDGSDGIFDTHLDASIVGLRRISASGQGIDGCAFFVNGPAGIIETTGRTSAITDTDIEVVAGLRKLSTNSLTGDDIDIFTLGKLSRLKLIDSTEFTAGGIRTMRVLDDITDSTIEVIGPFNRLTVGGMVDNSTIMATGIHGNIGRVIVTEDITDSTIYSVNNITLVQSKTGSIDNTTIVAEGSGDLDADLDSVRIAKVGTVKAAGNISGAITVGFLNNDNTTFDNPASATLLTGRLGRVVAGGGISADIAVAWADFDGDVAADITLAGYVGTITAKNDITGNIDAGLMQTHATFLEDGDMNADVDVTGRVNSIKAGGNLSGDVAIGVINSANDINALAKVSAKLGSLAVKGNVTGDIMVGGIIAGGDINGNVSVPERVGTLKIGGQFSGDLFVGTVEAGNDIKGDVTFDARVGAVKAEGGVTGDILVGNAYAGNVISNTLFGQGHVGSIISGTVVTGDIDISGNLNALVAEGDVGNAAAPGDPANLAIGGNLGRLLVGTSDVPGDLLSNISIGGKVSRITVTGAFPGSLDVGGNAGPIKITLDAGEAGDTFTIGGRLSKLTVLDPNLDPADPLAVPSDLWASLDVGQNLGKFEVQGDVWDDINIAGNMGRMLPGRVYSDIHIMGNLRYFDSGSVAARVGPGNYYTLTNPVGPIGSLLVDGDVGVVVVE